MRMNLARVLMAARARLARRAAQAQDTVKIARRCLLTGVLAINGPKHREGYDSASS